MLSEVAWGFAGRRGTATLSSMDRVKFGRALGVGARAAAKTVVMAVDAATAPNPSAKAQEGADASAGLNQGVNPPSGGGKAEASGVRMPQQVARTAAQVRQTGRALKRGGKQFNRAAGGRLARLSGALWLELTGVFFGIFAVSAIAGSWRLRAALRETADNHDAHVRLLISLTMAAVFGYFCVSSFVKANRRTERTLSGTLIGYT